MYAGLESDKLFALRAIDGYKSNRYAVLSIICSLISISTNFESNSSKIMFVASLFFLFCTFKLFDYRFVMYQRGITGSPTKKILMICAVYFVCLNFAWSLGFSCFKSLELNVSYVLLLFSIKIPKSVYSNSVYSNSIMKYSKLDTALGVLVCVFILSLVSQNHSLTHFLQVCCNVLFVIKLGDPSNKEKFKENIINLVILMFLLSFNTSSVLILYIVLDFSIYSYLKPYLKSQKNLQRDIRDYSLLTSVNIFINVFNQCSNFNTDSYYKLSLLYDLLLFMYCMYIIIQIIRLSKESIFWRRKRVYCCGVFDMLHTGHTTLFEKVNKYGDVIVGVLDDETVMAYKRRPVMTHDERCNAVKSAKYVDEIIPNCPLNTTSGFMKNHDIDLVAIGEEYLVPPYTYYEDCVREKKYVSIPRYTGISTSDLIHRIKLRDDLK